MFDPIRLPLMVVGTAVLLTIYGCGGGGSSSPVDPMPDTGQMPDTGNMMAGGEPDPPVPGLTTAGLKTAATAIPYLGRRSITQSSNTNDNGFTTDTAEGVFDRGYMNVTVAHQHKTRFTLNSRQDAVETHAGTSIRDDQTARRWLLQLQSPDSTTTARIFGEAPAGEFPWRAIHSGAPVGTNEIIVRDWEAGNRTEPLIPPDHIEYLRSLHVNQVGLVVDLHYEDSMDSTVELLSSSDVAVSTFSDDVLRQFIREFKENGIDVYLTLSLYDGEAVTSDRPAHRWQLGDPDPNDPQIAPENWPWSPNHPDHERFTAEFWETYTAQAVHIARIAEEEGVQAVSLGTETETLFRTRSGGHWPNHFKQELQTMVASVRDVFSGHLTYDMHYNALVDADFYHPGSTYLWDDLNLDIVGLSGWFPVADSVPSTVLSVESLEERYEQVFKDYLIPLASRNAGRPVVFLEYGATDTVGAPHAPDRSDFSPFEFSDVDGNGLDDGLETQANMYQALLNVMAKYPDVLDGVFWWDNWITSDDLWSEYWATRRSFAIRGKPSEEVVRSTYEAWGGWLTGGHWMQVTQAGYVGESGAFVDGPELAGTPALPSLGTATYEGFGTGGYALAYGGDFIGVAPGSHELGEYQGQLDLTADFEAALISGRIHSVRVNGLRTPSGGGTLSFNDVSVPYEIMLEAISFGRGGFTGQTSVISVDSEIEIAVSNGAWGGKFSSVSDDDGNPRLVAGTHGATFTSSQGTEGSFIGVFVGTTGR